MNKTLKNTNKKTTFEEFLKKFDGFRNQRTFELKKKYDPANYVEYDDVISYSYEIMLITYNKFNFEEYELTTSYLDRTLKNNFHKFYNNNRRQRLQTYYRENYTVNGGSEEMNFDLYKYTYNEQERLYINDNDNVNSIDELFSKVIKTLEDSKRFTVSDMKKLNKLFDIYKNESAIRSFKEYKLFFNKIKRVMELEDNELFKEIIENGI